MEKLQIKLQKNHAVKKMSAQAVGGAVGWNPICLIIPCHRVIGANSSLTGTAEELKIKYHCWNQRDMI